MMRKYIRGHVRAAHPAPADGWGCADGDEEHNPPDGDGDEVPDDVTMMAFSVDDKALIKEVGKFLDDNPPTDDATDMQDSHLIINSALRALTKDLNAKKVLADMIGDQNPGEDASRKTMHALIESVVKR
eukprot:1089971-Alexandrium_andersonii.AAC.1